jgi:hypothetical protein
MGRAWKTSMSYLEVFSVSPEQLSKEPNSGEFLPKGSFVVRGRVAYYKPKLELCAGKDRTGRTIVGPQRAVLAHCEKGYLLLQGNDKTTDVAKRLSALLGAPIDDLVAAMPAGGVKLGKLISQEEQHDAAHGA